MGNVIKINEKEQYNAASCIKIFILVELFNQINNGTKSRNDGGIVSTKYVNYILTILIKKFKDENYLNDEYVYNQGRQIK